MYAWYSTILTVVCAFPPLFAVCLASQLGRGVRGISVAHMYTCNSTILTVVCAAPPCLQFAMLSSWLRGLGGEG